MLNNLNDAILNANKGVKNNEGCPQTNELLYSRWEKVFRNLEN